MKKALIASLATSALVIGAFAMSASAYVFSNYLSVGSTGNDVVALQSFLVSKGFLTMPAGVAEGYFGSLTKAAVVAYQASVSLPSTGYVGPMTVKVLNAGGSTASTGAATCPAGYSCAQTTPVTFACPSGWTCTPLAGTTGTTVTGASTATGITTPGVQGILSVTQGPISNSVANAGQTKVPILDIRMQAQYSDLAVQSVQLDLGPSTNIYNFIYSNLYLVDPTTGNVLSTIALNPSTVVQNGNNYVVSVTGFNFIVPKGTYKDLVVEGDLYNQINTPYTSTCGSSCTTQGTVSLPGNTSTLGSGQWYPCS
jgi:peptidoglycan hydrolase-like protein with peptidoglycan-binding domain